MGAVGASEKSMAPRLVRDAGGDAFLDGAGALPAAYRATFAKVNKGRFVSQGHASGRWDVDVWANEIAQKALSSRTREVPPGAIVVEEHYERAEPLGPSEGAGRSIGPIMVMEKK